MNCRKYKIIPFLLVVVLLSGCTTKYEQKDIYDYIEENYALEDVKVSKERTELTGEDDYTDYLWEITADDIKFRVLDDYHWGMETLTNHLTDDYEDVMLKKYYDSKILPHFTLVNSTPFVRQYDILSNKWGVLLCQKEYQTNDIRRSSRKWL